MAEEGGGSTVHGNTSLASGLAFRFAIDNAVDEPVTEPIGELVCVSFRRIFADCSSNLDPYADAASVSNACELQCKCCCAGIYVGARPDRSAAPVREPVTINERIA